MGMQLRQQLVVLVMMAGILGGCASTPMLERPRPQPQANAGGMIKLLPPPGAYPTSPPPTANNPARNPGGFVWQSEPTNNPQATPSAALTATPLKVGLLLPLSGKSASMGQAMQNAAQLAAQDTGANFTLLPRDSGETAEQAAAAARALVAEGADIVVGPLFAPQVRAVQPMMGRTPILALSNDPSLANANTYVLGFSASQQVARIISFARTQGKNNFAAILPGNAYGQLVERGYRAALQQGGQNVQIVYYGVGATGLTQSIAQLGKYKDRLDAIVIPEGGTVLNNIVQQLMAAGFDLNKIKLLGSGQWEEMTSAPAGMQGWFPSPPEAARQRFVRQYQNNFTGRAPRLASLAYDAVAMLGALQRLGLAWQNNNLQSPGGFDGVDGVFRLSADGSVERQLAIYQLSASGTEMVDSARGF
jgi:ABC-type branched-subunit amino acid transport system substrate-binding protein